MKKTLVVLLTLVLLVPFLQAQIRTGNLTGKVVTQDGQPLPGVTITLTSDVSAQLTAVTNEMGVFRFRELFPSRNYVVTAELEGFKQKSVSGVGVSLGVTSEVNLVMELGAVSEEIVVEGKAAVIDTKATQINTVVTREELQSLPTGRDPFVILAMAPGVQTDRVNVAGSESGQQASSVGRGEGTYNNNTWNVDGVNVTDPAAIGATPSYWDFDAFEEMNVTTGGGDVTIQSGGIALNMVTRRGGNKHALGGRVYFTDEKFQGENVTDELIQQFYRTDITGSVGIRNIKDWGFNLGGPIIKDKLFYWGSIGVNDIKTRTITGVNDDTLLQNFAFKLNLQAFENNRVEFFFHVGAKIKEGRSVSATLPKGLGQGGQAHFGSPILKLQMDQTFGSNLFLSLKYAASDAGFRMWPMNDPGSSAYPTGEYATWYNMANATYGDAPNTHSGYAYNVKRPKTNYALHLTYFNDVIFNASHEWKFGFEYSTANQNLFSSEYYSGTGSVRFRRNYNTVQLDLNGDGLNQVPAGWNYLELRRPLVRDQYTDYVTAFIQDTLTFGNLTLKLGARYDLQIPEMKTFEVKAIVPDHPVFTNNFTPDLVSRLAGIFPNITVPGVKDPDWAVPMISPRIGATYDLKGDGKTILKLSGAIYGGIYGVGEAGNFLPYGTSGNLDFWWLDNGDGKADFTELYWWTLVGNGRRPVRVWDDVGNFIGNAAEMQSRGVLIRGFDFFNPGDLSPSRQLIDGKRSPQRTYEALFTIDRELARDLAISLNLTYRLNNNFWWNTLYYPETGLCFDGIHAYSQAGTIPATIPTLGSTMDAAGKPYFLPKPEYGYSSYLMYKPRPDYYQNYMSADLVLVKRLSNRWMAQGSITLQNQYQYWGESGYGARTNTVIAGNPTNKWAYDSKSYSPLVGGTSGMINQYIFARWMVKLSGLYQLPADFNISANFHAREGNILARSFTLNNQTWGNRSYFTTEVMMEEFGKTRLPINWDLSIRLEKMISIGEGQRVYLMIDVFNVFNANFEERRYQYEMGTYYTHNNTFVPDAYPGKIANLANPRVFRFGIRFQF